MAEITIPYAELIDAVAAIDRMRSDHPERDNDPATIGIKLSTPSGDVGEWVGHPRSERCLRRLHNDPGGSPGNLSLRNLPGMGCIKSPGVLRIGVRGGTVRRGVIAQGGQDVDRNIARWIAGACK